MCLKWRRKSAPNHGRSDPIPEAIFKIIPSVLNRLKNCSRHLKRQNLLAKGVLIFVPYGSKKGATTLGTMTLTRTTLSVMKLIIFPLCKTTHHNKNHQTLSIMKPSTTKQNNTQHNNTEHNDI